MDRPRASLAALLILAAISTGACGEDEAPPDASTEPDARPPAGRMSLSWRVEEGGAEVSCDDAGAQFVVIRLVRQGEAVGETDSFNCGAAQATTREVNTGTYDLTLDLVDSSLESLLAEPIVQIGVEVSEGSETAIGEVVFEIE
jgi:hypothetical protein